jgi:hypothetical protein
MQGIRKDFRRLYLTCLMISIAEFALVHFTNVFVVAAVIIGPFIVGWQLALVLAYMHGLQGKAALDASFKWVRVGKMLWATGIAISVV